MSEKVLAEQEAGKKERTLGRLPEDGLLRLWEVLSFLPIKKSTWYDGIAKGIYPKPVRLGRATCWRARDIRRLIEEGTGA